MRILGIETSCDETAAAVVENGRHIHSNVIASQVEIHARYGGVVPEVASRQHLLQIAPVLREALSQAKVSWRDLDAIAVTVGPGLAGSLLVGVNMAKAIAVAKALPVIGINHLEGHVYANWLRRDDDPSGDPHLPLVSLIASGGHTDLTLMEEHGRHLLLGRTRDDAAGEAFDKVARVLGLGYPGGPAIDRIARHASSPHSFPRAWLKGNHDFSFSGLKTAVLRLVEDIGILNGKGEASIPDPDSSIANIAAGFQESVVDVLVTKTVEAAQKYEAKEILLSGGVAANSLLRETLFRRSPLPVRFPPLILCTDNAAMIAACGYFCLQAGAKANENLDVVPNLRLI